MNQLICGTLRKMTTLYQHPIAYYLPLQNDNGKPPSEWNISLNPLIDTTISISFTGAIYCCICGKKTPRTFQEGLCYRCFQSAPQAAPCIFNPELCRAHLGEGRDPQWEEQHHNQEHIVYLALSSSVKVGVTRATQVPYRWIDQGAIQAIQVAQTPNRYQAGTIEVALKKQFTDKTNWQQMLKNKVDITLNLKIYKQTAFTYLPKEKQVFYTQQAEIIHINYPVLAYPQTIKSVSLDKKKHISARLIGIKGQYLLFDTGEVLNIRKHAGYEIEFSTTSGI